MRSTWTFLHPSEGQTTPDWWGPGRIRIREHSDGLHLESPYRIRAMSSAVVGGGLCDVRHLFNFQVESDYARVDPANDLVERLVNRGIRPEDSLALMTAVRVADASFVSAQGDGWELLTVVTCGFGNAASVQDVDEIDDVRVKRTIGTINIISVVHGWLTDGALVNAVMTATEAKASALSEMGILTRSHQHPATGTTSDAIVIGSDRTPGCTPVAYTGLATPFGRALAKTVYHGVLDSGAKYRARLLAAQTPAGYALRHIDPL
ncbi:adenosylcobinamide amidohydrolase [Alicyclobacillus fastidiosus]|uniref:Adenosylcobinamide amidohydrolase n=1 Tax=Alicyclobacillus fastidiosus TaxID=392011 RepID=A0ABY6ZJH4_9BACL|nr:adenosylcobinamide amidohydrolase [Alicyclobacillus fastidiosus]WAH43002.1 adenosylcobinamide amidohydrolase [Alicyclobacillus fastidiosus]GMA64972.1 hypothetical protein GCM10025859_54120 [Alicyclobacillus fastidiosus]